MSLEILKENAFESLLLKNTPLIDVRAPVEFLLGSIPNSVNLPIMNDEERAKVGTEYKLQGSELALKLGHDLVSGEIRETRLDSWKSFIQKNPSCVLYCFRGGKRSQISQEWLQEQGVVLPRLDGGYKNMRQFLLDRMQALSEVQSYLPLAGPTGSGKTTLITELEGHYPVIDLEALARHRGSAFGAMKTPQPSQIDFENQLALALMRFQSTNRPHIKPLIEDESRLIGRCALPKTFFEKLNSSPIVLVDEKLETRVQNIFQDYVLNSAIGESSEGDALAVFNKYKSSVIAISKKLGGARSKEVLDLLQASEDQYRSGAGMESNRRWIESLLVYYYDPLYLSSLERRSLKIVFTGSKDECFKYLKETN